MWKQYLLVAALFGAYVAHDRYQNSAQAAGPDLGHFRAGAEYTDGAGNRYTSKVTATSGGAYLIELTPLTQPAHSGM
jgi:hypothetical protein